MQLRYRLFRRGRTGGYFLQDRVTGAQESLRTKSKDEAKRLLSARNEAYLLPESNRRMAEAYLVATDPEGRTRTWQQVFEAAAKSKPAESTIRRWENAIKDKAFDPLRRLTLFETRPEHFSRVLEAGTVSTNVFLRRIHNYALGMEWLLRPVLAKKLWPKPRYQQKRAITLEEHHKIIARERNAERRAFYQLCWHTGGSQSDVANLTAEQFDRVDRVLTYRRAKNGQISRLQYGQELETILADLPSEGPLFPYLRTVRECDRATEFKQRCKGLGIKGVTLHCYRHSWAQRAAACGYPQRFAQAALGHNSKAVHQQYAGKAEVKYPSIEEWTRSLGPKIIKVDFPVPGNAPGNGEIEQKTGAC